MDSETLESIREYTIHFWEVWRDSVAVIPNFSANAVHVVLLLDGKLLTFTLAKSGADFEELL